MESYNKPDSNSLKHLTVKLELMGLEGLMENKGIAPLLEVVADITGGDRQRDYGRPLINHLRIAIAWSNFLMVTINPVQAAWMMLLLKPAREVNTPKRDNLIDTAGYAVCADDMYLQLIEMGQAGDYDDAMTVMSELTRGEMTNLLEDMEQSE
jgi:hypothetical protein